MPGAHPQISTISHRLALGRCGTQLIAAMNHAYHDPQADDYSSTVEIYDLHTDARRDAYGPPDEWFLLEIL